MEASLDSLFSGSFVKPKELLKAWEAYPLSPRRLNREPNNSTIVPRKTDLIMVMSPLHHRESAINQSNHIQHTVFEPTPRLGGTDRATCVRPR